jgi:hypothetical protein
MPTRPPCDCAPGGRNETTHEESPRRSGGILLGKVSDYGQTGFSAPSAKAPIMSWATSSWNCTGGDFMK